MAVVVNSYPVGTDLVSFSDQHLSGVSGAHRMLLAVTRQIRRLDATHNDLGTMGSIALFEGLKAVRARFAAQTDEYWGMREINLAANSVGDDGLTAAAFYCARDLCMRELFLQNNVITLEHVVSRVVVQLNASRLAELSLATNPLSTPAVSTLFEALDAPHLRKLHLSACQLTSDVVSALCSFLRSPRSQRMQLLELNGNSLGRAGVTAILDAVEDANYSLSRIGLFANSVRRWAEEDGGGLAGATGGAEDGGVGAGGPEGAGSADEAALGARRTEYDPDPDEEDATDPASMSWQIGERLPALQKRNAQLTRRVRRAALRSLAPARIILHARPPSDAETAARVLSAAAPDAAPEPRFRLMDLPPELRLHVARHASGDAYALTDAQWVRVRSHAEKRETITRLRKRLRDEMADAAGESGRKYAAMRVRDEWLAEIGCEWWSLENEAYWDQWNLQ